MEADHKAEMARWTPELRAEAKALADKAYPNGKAAIQAVMASKIRKPGDAERDKYRHPVETLDFFGFKPTMTVLEFGPGEGWYTELLAPALAKKGKLLATNGDPNGPPEERSTFYAQRFKLFLDTSPEALRQGGDGHDRRQGAEAPADGGHRRHGDPRARAPRHGAEQPHGRLARRDAQGAQAERRARHRAAPRQGRRDPGGEREEGLPPGEVGHREDRGRRASSSRESPRSTRTPRTRRTTRTACGRSRRASASATRIARSTPPSARAIA